MGRYRIDAELSRGGMGTVYRAFDTNLQTPVALKENAFQTEYATTQFEREALILARLRHPSLPRVIQHFTEGDKQYLVMDFVDGHTFEQLMLQQGGVLSETDIVEWGTQLCVVLAYLHNHNPPIIYRDLKPANVMVETDSNTVKLIDFGIVCPKDLCLFLFAIRA